MKKFISTLAASCLVALATAPAKALLPETGSLFSSGALSPTIPTIQTTSKATTGVQVGQNGINTNANASSEVQVGGIKISTCANANVTLGSYNPSGISGISGCPNPVKVRKVPEPGTIFALTLLGALLIFSRGKSFSITKASKH